MIGVGAAGCLAVVPDDQNIRRAVAVGQLDERFPVGTTADVVHPIAALERFPGGLIKGGGTLEDLRIPLDERPEEAGRMPPVAIAVVRVGASLRVRGGGGRGPVVVGRPPDLARSRPGGRRGVVVLRPEGKA